MRINSNNFFNRRQEHCLPHFTSTFVKQTSENDVEKINSWVYEFCHGRYAIIDDVSFEGTQPQSRIKVGFEEPADLTLFALSGLMGKE